SLAGVQSMEGCDEVAPPACSAASGQSFPLGTTHVICTATHPICGNTTSCGFDVTVQDTIAPAIQRGSPAAGGGCLLPPLPARAPPPARPPAAPAPCPRAAPWTRRRWATGRSP